jgi:hypothetical protein
VQRSFPETALHILTEKDMTCVFKGLFIVVGLIASVFYGIFGQTILGNGGVLQKPFKVREVKISDTQSADTHWSWWLHQVWLNFAGSVIGWSALYCLIFCRDSVNKLPAMRHAPKYTIPRLMRGMWASGSNITSSQPVAGG